MLRTLWRRGQSIVSSELSIWFEPNGRKTLASPAPLVQQLPRVSHPARLSLTKPPSINSAL